MQIISYNYRRDIDVYFEDYNWIYYHARYDDFQNGQIKCPYEPRLYGVGYIGEGRYKTKENGKHTKCYNTWNAICPEIAHWTVNEEQWNGHPLPLYLVIKYHLYHSFNEYKLPESLRKENEINMNFIDKQIEKTLTPAKDNNSGCLGIILLIAIPLSALYFLF